MVVLQCNLWRYKKTNTLHHIEKQTILPRGKQINALLV